MASTAFQTAYRQEFISTFEQRQSLLRGLVTTETMVKGNQAVFLVAGSGGATAVTRGVNGLIPARSNDLTQVTLTLQEWHDLVQMTGFNIFASQGDQRRIMQINTVGVINRKVDQDILEALSAATQTTGAATTMSVALAAHALAILGNADVPIDGNINGVMSPGMFAYLIQTPEFTSADFVDNKPFSGSGDMQRFRWALINWVVHPNLSGAAGAAEVAYVFHRSAIGHAINTGGIETPVGVNEEQDYSWARASAYMGAKLLQNTGVVKITHDGSAFAAV